MSSHLIFGCSFLSQRPSSESLLGVPQKCALASPSTLIPSDISPANGQTKRSPIFLQIIQGETDGCQRCFFALAVMLGFAFWLMGELKYVVPSCKHERYGQDAPDPRRVLDQRDLTAEILSP